MRRPPPLFSLPHTRVGLVLLSLLLFLALIFFVFSSPSRPFFSAESIRECSHLDRSSYSFSPAIFSELPPPPSCFESVIRAFRSGAFTDASFFDSNYFLQPEFYPSFRSQGVSVWMSPSSTHYGAVGYGAYPTAQTLSISSLAPSSIHFFVYSGFGIRGLQRMTLSARFEDPSDANYFSLVLDDSSSSGFILGPTFPKFSRDWAHPVSLTLVPLSASFSRPVVVHVRTIPSTFSFSDSRADFVPVFDAVDYVGEKDVFTLRILPPA